MPGKSPRPARPAACVSSWNVRLGGAEIRQAQADIRVHHAHQRDVGNVVAFGDHLRAHQNVESPSRKPGRMVS